jgi:hypothetical protein
VTALRHPFLAELCPLAHLVSIPTHTPPPPPAHLFGEGGARSGVHARAQQQQQGCVPAAAAGGVAEARGGGVGAVKLWEGGGKAKRTSGGVKSELVRVKAMRALIEP